MTDLKLLQQKFWNQFKSFLEMENSSLSTEKLTEPKSYYQVKIDSSDAYLSMNILAREQQISCQLVIPKNKALFEKLEHNKILLEQRLGNLEWKNNPNLYRCIISKTMSANPINENHWQSYFQWLKETGEEFQTVFKSYLNG